jgi:REP element-mobilizing transposase RayT
MMLGMDIGTPSLIAHGRRTLGFHIVISGYGLWLPGDERGSWSEAWDDEIGFREPHALHEGDPVRMRMAAERMKHAPVRLNHEMVAIVIEVLAECQRESDWRIAAASVESTHAHLLLTYTTRDIDGVVKWLKQRMTKAIHQRTSHAGPVWASGKWRSFIFDQEYCERVTRYIERHNERRGVGPRPYAFLNP